MRIMYCVVRATAAASFKAEHIRSTSSWRLAADGGGACLIGGIGVALITRDGSAKFSWPAALFSNLSKLQGQVQSSQQSRVSV